MSQIKIISSADQDWLEPASQLIKVSSRGLVGEDRANFVKRASAKLADSLDTLIAGQQSDEPLVHLLAIGATESYGCFFAGAPVQTETGFKPIETVVVGDNVLTDKNRFCKVTATFITEYSGSRVAMKAACLPVPVISTANHPFLVVRANNFTVHHRAPCFFHKHKRTKAEAVTAAVAQAEFVSADDIRVGDYLVIPVAPKATDAASLDLSAAYVMGLYVAEGCVSREYRDMPSRGKIRRIIFTMNNTVDQPIVARLRKTLCEWGYGLEIQPSLTSDYGIRATLGHNVFAAKCAEFFGTLAETKFLHPHVFSQSTEWKLQFLAGYFDGDGCLTTNAKQPRFENTLRANTVSLNLAIDIQRLLANVGIPASISQGCNKASNGCFGSKDFVIYEISVDGAYSGVIADRCERLKVLNPVKKQAQADGFTDGQYLLVPVREILRDVVTDETKFNIEVEDDNTYVTLVAGHNSNRNGDGFRRHACQTYHPTFVKHAHFFRDHQNKDPKKSYGRVVTSWFNDPMDRIELIVGLNASEKRAEINGGMVADKEMAKLAADKNIAVSMACRVAYDVCSYCNNKAATKEAYCQGSEEGGMCKAGGLTEKLGQLIEIDGGIHHLHADNPHPRFFDISHVIRPADRIAYVSGLLKSAGAAAGVKTLPTRFAITVPTAAYTDLSDIDNQLLKAASDLATIPPADQSFIPALLPSQREVQLPGQVKLAEVWKALLDQQICLPLSQFLDVLGGHRKVAMLVAPHVTDSFDELLCDPDITATLQNSGYAPAAAAPAQLQKWASTLVADFSLQPTAIVRRSQLAAIQRLPLQSHTLQKIASSNDNVAAKSLAAQYALYQAAYLGHLPTSESVLTASLLRLQNQVTPYYL